MNLTSAEAEDVSSDTWIDAMRGISRFQGNEIEFRAWLFTIARRRMIDLYRKHARKPEVFGNDLSDLANDDTYGIAFSDPSAMNDLSTDAAIAIIRSLLPADQAEVILLRVIGGFDTTDAAKIMGRSASNIRVLQHRGLRRLAGHFASQDVSHESITG